MNSKLFDKLINARVKIAQSELEQKLLYLPVQLIQATLPHRDPGDQGIWVRRNGSYTLSLQQGMEDGKLLGLPYGTIPRLLLFWMTTEALKTKSRKLVLGKSLAAFMSEVGLNSRNGTGPRSDSTRLREQMRRLFRCHISFDHLEYTEKYKKTDGISMEVAPARRLFWDLKQPSQDTLFESWILLGEFFYEAILEAPVPADVNAIRALKNSPLALDLYSWATYRSFTQRGKSEDLFIPWATFGKQLGVEFQELYELKRKTRKALEKVQQVYPGLRMTTTSEGLILSKSRTSVFIKPKKIS